MVKFKKRLFSLIIVFLLAILVIPNIAAYNPGVSFTSNLGNIYLPRLVFNTNYKKELTEKYVKEIKQKIIDSVQVNLDDVFRKKSSNKISINRTDFKIHNLESLTIDSAKQNENIIISVESNNSNKFKNEFVADFEVGFRIAPIDLLTSGLIDIYNMDLGKIHFANNSVNERELLDKLFQVQANRYIEFEEKKLSIEDLFKNKEIKFKSEQHSDNPYFIIEGTNHFFSGECIFKFQVGN